MYVVINREDDLKINIKSMSILFGKFGYISISLFQVVTLILLFFIAKFHPLFNLFYGFSFFNNGTFCLSAKLDKQKK